MRYGFTRKDLIEEFKAWRRRHNEYTNCKSIRHEEVADFIMYKFASLESQPTEKKP